MACPPVVEPGVAEPAVEEPVAEEPVAEEPVGAEPVIPAPVPNHRVSAWLGQFRSVKPGAWLNWFLVAEHGHVALGPDAQGLPGNRIEFAAHAERAAGGERHVRDLLVIGTQNDVVDRAQILALGALDLLPDQIAGAHERHRLGHLARGRLPLRCSRRGRGLILLRGGPLVLIRRPLVLVLVRRLFCRQSIGAQNSHEANDEKPPQKNFSLTHVESP